MYSPKLKPVAMSAFIPFSSNIFSIAKLVVNIANCAFSVFISSSSGPSKHIFLISTPEISSAFLYILFASSYLS